ncbi:MAG: single-stranded-DNA-specific exonuclease RecJ [Vampirovibrionales bacterium]|nr:single-stranded-DNA-specific exonuclease RecJ [Vampirovibrionales bacterium]
MSKHNTKRWQLRQAQTQQARPAKPDAALIAAAHGSPIIARLLLQRGYKTPEQIKAFLNLEAFTPRPGTEMPDAEAALTRINQAIDAQEPILVYGDFDVDGLSGSSILMEALTTLGAKVSHYIPDRIAEGHGLNSAALCRLVSTRQLKLVITTDTGITNFNEISLIKGLGVDTIVTDHHHLPDNLPPAIANVNPQRLGPDHPFFSMCGAGTAFKLMEALLHQRLPKADADAATEKLTDLAAVGTVADIVSFSGENRWLVWRGLKQLAKRERVGLHALLKLATVADDAPLNTETVGFTIGPRLNALGRLSNANDGVLLLTTQDAQQAEQLGQRLEALNRRRQELCETTFIEAQQIINNQGGLGQQRAVIAGMSHWEPGIIGIVCSRIVDKYRVPAFLYVVNEQTGEVRGSARGLEGFHVHKALQSVEDLLTGYGGHAGAGGFYLKLSNLANFKQRLHAECQRQVTDEMMLPLVWIDEVIQAEQANLNLIDLIEHLAPFGPDNPPVTLAIEGVKVIQQRQLGAEGKHRKVILAPYNKGAQASAQAKPIEALEWGAGQNPAFTPNQPYCFAVSLEKNTFNGETRVQTIIKDAKPALKAEACLGSEGAWLSVTENEPIPEAEPLPAPNKTHTPAGVAWIDHRRREHVGAFVRDVILPGELDVGCAVFHEGRLPELPLWQADMLMSRQQLRRVNSLVFWDLPPCEASLRQILSVASPVTVHWVGGKFQSMPVTPEPVDMLRLLGRVAQSLIRNQVPVPVATIAAQLATSEAVVLAGFAVLAETRWLSVKVINGPAENASRGVQSLKIETGALQKPEGEPLQWLSGLAGVQFVQALTQVSAFRKKLLQAPLPELQALYQVTQSVANAPAAITAAAGQEESLTPAAPELPVALA